MKTQSEIEKLGNLAVHLETHDGGTGVIWRAGRAWATVVWSFGGGWDHVSICPFRGTPSWYDMCYVKDMFFYAEECVIQFHPAKSDYVNNMENCLHLWRPQNVDFPVPPSIMVGVKPGQTAEDVKKAVAELCNT